MKQKKRKVNIRLGGIEEFGRQFVETWKRGEAGNVPEADHETIYFMELSTMLNTLSGKRLELLRSLQQRPGVSIYGLAKRLGRHYKNVHDDIALLKNVGLVNDDNGLAVTYARIHAEIDLAA